MIGKFVAMNMRGYAMPAAMVLKAKKGLAFFDVHVGFHHEYFFWSHFHESHKDLTCHDSNIDSNTEASSNSTIFCCPT